MLVHVRGQRARGSRPQKRGKNVSMIGAIALKGIVASINLLGATDGLTFEAFVIQKLVLTALFIKEKKLNSLLENLEQHCSICLLILLILIQLKAFGRKSRTLFVLSVQEPI